MSHPRRDIEHRAGVEPIEDIVARRQTLVAEVERLRPLYGPLGGFEKRRKIELERLKALIRAHALSQKESLSEVRCDAEAHAHPAYLEYVEAGLREAERWVAAEEALISLTMIAQRDQALLRFLSHEPR